MTRNNITSQLESLNQQQRQAVVADASRLLILAGAGTGKTRVLTLRLALQLEKNPNQYALAVTHTNRAAAEMRQRLQTLAPQIMPRAMVSTFHVFGAGLLRRYADLIGRNRNFTIYDNSDSLAIIRGITADRKQAGRYLNLINRAREADLVREEQLVDYCQDPCFIEYFNYYQHKLQASGNVDFSDLICLPLLLLRNFPAVLEEQRRQLQQLFVDEFQDINLAQLRLLQLLCGQQQNLTLVGDDDQSIYSFRGADLSGIVELQNYFHGSKIMRLEINYRSTAAILNLANQVISYNKNRLGKTLRPADNNAGSRPTLLFFADQNEEARYLAQLYQQQPNAEMTVLYRSHAQAAAFEKELRLLQIPNRILGGQSFFAYDEIKTLLAYIAFFLNSRDEVAFLRMVNCPARGLGRVAVQQIRQQSRGDFFIGLRNCQLGSKAAIGRNQLLELEAMFRHWLSCLPLQQLLEQLAEESGLTNYYQQKDEQEDGQRSQRLLQLFTMAEGFDSGVAGLMSFLQFAGLGETADNDNREKLLLSTLHSAKGMEFDRIFISGLEEGVFPSAHAITNAELEEERRLFYVGITRAKKELFISCVNVRAIYGRKIIYDPSPLLAGLTSIQGIALDDSQQQSPGQLLGKRLLHCEYGSGKVVRVKGEVLTVLLESGSMVKILSTIAKEKIEWLD